MDVLIGQIATYAISLIVFMAVRNRFVRIMVARPVFAFSVGTVVILLVAILVWCVKSVLFK